eukprot:gene32266-43089_t
MEKNFSPDGGKAVVVVETGGPEPNAAETTPPIVIDRYQFKEDARGWARPWAGFATPPRPVYGAPKIFFASGVVKVSESFTTLSSFSEPVPTRRVVLVWRRTFTRYEAIAALRNAIYACPLVGVQRLS